VPTSIKYVELELICELDHEVEFKNWPHPGDVVTIAEVISDEEGTVCAYTDGSK
jgi:hypothetical protein